jgi:outer membrane protein OmpA-like peptidoglycan-associated protein
MNQTTRSMPSRPKRIARLATLWSLVAVLGIGSTGCESLSWKTFAATGIGCAAGLGIGAVIDEANRKQSNKDRRKDVFAIFKKRKAQNNGKIVGLATGCLAGLGVGLYLDLMHDDIEGEFGDRGIELEKVKAPNGDTEELLVKMDGDISFDTGSSNLSGTASNNVDTLKEALGKYPETKVRVWGHTDGTGSRATNDRLSRQRAEEVADELALGSDRIKESKGWANERPLPGTNRSGEARANRRVEVFILAED